MQSIKDVISTLGNGDFGGRMHGVILWSDKAQDRAVIWCEDHGDLAFFKGIGAGADHALGLTPGDLVQFDVREENQMRLAENLRLVAADEYPTLMQDLKNTGQKIGAGARAGSVIASAVSAPTVVPFARGGNSARMPRRA